MVIVNLLTILLTCSVYMEYVSFAAARDSSFSSESMHKLIKRELNSKACGVRGSDMPTVTQIVGGHQSTSVWPWMVSVVHDGYHTCGGSVLDDRHVITAAHCFDDDDDPQHFSVTVDTIESGKGITHEVQAIHVHEGYTKPPLFHNDIALLILKDPLPAHIIPVCLPETNDLGDAETFTITGFGTSEEGGSASKVLQEVHDIPYINPEKCDGIMHEILGTKSEITQNQLCTGADDGGHGSCQGDSGGPVTHQEEDRSWTLVGLVSYSIGCVRPGVPTVHTRLYAYRDWIAQHMAA